MSVVKAPKSTADGDPKAVDESSSPGWQSITAMAALGLLSLFSYEIARPTIKTMFQQAYGAHREPWAWIGVAIAVTLVVMLYGKAAQSSTLNQLGVRSIGWIIATLIALIGLVKFDVPGAVFALYIWKDIYIVLIIELFWSFANSSLKFESARWLYGFFCFIGGIGAALGGTVTVALGEMEFGLLNSVMCVLIPLVLCWVCPLFCPAVGASSSSERPSLTTGFKTVARSKYLGLLLSVIVLSQVCITLIDYDFSIFFESAYPDESVRQSELSNVYRWINLSSMGLQLLTGAVLVVLKLRGTLLGIPVMLGVSVLVFLLHPMAGIMIFAKISSKAMDYSIFRATKELLYLPLDRSERVEGKAVVDVMGYRVAKAGASALVLFVTPLVTVPYVSSMMAVCLSLVWIYLVHLLVTRHQMLTKEIGS